MGIFTRLADEEESALVKHAADWPEYPSLESLEPNCLGPIARQHGIDFATAVLFARVVGSPKNGPFIRRIEQLRQGEHRALPVHDLTVVIAPGAFYEQYPETGADGSAPREAAERAGCRTALIPTDGVGTPSANGQIICDWLSARREEKIVLVSLSKGGADVKLALANHDAGFAFRNVATWISIGGILNGSPMISWLCARRLRRLFCRLLFWWRGRDFRLLDDMDRRPNGALDFEMRLPQHLQLVHVVGFPLRRHLSCRLARRWHRRLAHMGPNDSVTILADICQAPGLVLPIWGSDHYLDSGWEPRSLVGALLQYLEFDLQSFRPLDFEDAVADTCAT